MHGDVHVREARLKISLRCLALPRHLRDKVLSGGYAQRDEEIRVQNARFDQSSDPSHPQPTYLRSTPRYALLFCTSGPSLSGMKSLE